MRDLEQINNTVNTTRLGERGKVCRAGFASKDRNAISLSRPREQQKNTMKTQPALNRISILLAAGTAALLLIVDASHAATSTKKPSEAPDIKLKIINNTTNTVAESIDFQYTMALVMTNSSSETLNIEGYASTGFVDFTMTSPFEDETPEDEFLSGEYHNTCTCTYESVSAAWKTIAADNDEIDDGFHVWKVSTASHDVEVIRAYDACMTEFDVGASCSAILSGNKLTITVTVVDL